MTNSAVSASDVSGLFALKLFRVRLTKTKLSPLNLSKSQIESGVPQFKLSDWGQQANCFSVGFFFYSSASDYRLGDFAVLNKSLLCFH